MNNDGEQLTKFFSNQALGVLIILAICSCFEIYKRADLSLAVGSIGAIIGIVICALSARAARNGWDKALVVAGIVVTVGFQLVSLDLA